MRDKRVNKIFKKNIILITVFVVIFAIISGAFYIVHNNTEHLEKINMLEIEEMSKTETSLKRILLQIAQASVYFSTITFSIDENNHLNNWN